MGSRLLKSVCLSAGLALVPGFSPGCSSALPAYSLRTFWPHKDIVVVSIFVEEKLDVEEYLAIVTIETEELLRNPLPSEVPIYEVRFEFYLPGTSPPLRKRVAEVSVRPPDVGPPHARTGPPPEVILY